MTLQITPIHTAASPRPLQLRLGFDIQLDLPAPTPMVLMLYVHPERARQLPKPEIFKLEPQAPVQDFFDSFGNLCGRAIAPAGLFRIAHETLIDMAYEPERLPPIESRQHRIDELPGSALQFLLGSRYCEVDRLSSIAWDLFGKIPPGGARALAINEWVNQNVAFGYRYARHNKTASDVYTERTGVCRDMMHLAISFCRALNIPARYATGYLADIDVAPDPTPMDFSAFYEVYLDGQWWPLDARHLQPRIGRVLVARGRDAADVAMITSFGAHALKKFTVVTDQVTTDQTPHKPTPLAMSA